MVAIVQAILALVLRQLGRVFNTLFGWANTLLFGKVPEKRQIYLSLTSFGSIVWMLLALGIAFPQFAAFLLAFVTFPEWVHPNWIRLAMLGGTLLLPPVIGVGSSLLVEDQPAQADWRHWGQVALKGYLLTLGLAVTLLLMLVIAPLLKIRNMLRGWTTGHVAVVIDARDYREVLNDLQAALRRGGIETERQAAPWLLRLPTRIITSLAGGWVHDAVGKDMTVLNSPQLEILVHPCDLVIHGGVREVHRARAVLTSELTCTKAHQTWTKESQELEDRIVHLWQRLGAASRGAAVSLRPELRVLEKDIHRAEVTYEEWEILFRQLLMLQRDTYSRLLKGEGASSSAEHPLVEVDDR